MKSEIDNAKVEYRAWRGAIEERTKELENYPNNLQNIHTPFDLCNCIISKLKEQGGFEDKTFCTLNLEFVEVLCYDFGVSKDKIWFVTDCPEKVTIAKSGRYNGINVIKDDYLKWEPNMKFDNIIGNPPYQDSTAKSSKKAWNRFLDKSLEICKENGFITFITPFSWATPSHKAFDIFKTHDVPIVNLNGKKYFPDVGTTISWYVIQNCLPKRSTKIISGDETVVVNLKDMDFLPCILNKTSMSIVSKILSEKSIGVMFDSFCHSQREDRVAKTNDNCHQFPVKHTIDTTLWSNVKHPNTNIKKVIFPISSSMKAEYDPVGEFGCSQHYAWIEVKSEVEAVNLICYLNSKIISFLRKSTQWTASWSKPILKKIAKIPLNRSWTDLDLYKFFNLTQEEIEYIEKIVN